MKFLISCNKQKRNEQKKVEWLLTNLNRIESNPLLVIYLVLY